MIEMLNLTYDKQNGIYMYNGEAYRRIKSVVSALNEDGLSCEEAIKQIQILKKCKL